MEKERMLELLQNCIDDIINNGDDPIGFLIDEIGFTDKELIELGFNEELVNERIAE